MLKIINKNTFEVVMGIMTIAAAFYLAVITRIVPLPENVLTRVGEFAANVMSVLIACGAWLTSFLP
jgi:hypothetical protein